MGHRVLPPCDTNLYLSRYATTAPFTSRAAFAAGRLRSHGQPGSYQLAGRISNDKRACVQEWSSSRMVGNPSTAAHPAQAFGSMPMRSLTADRIRPLLAAKVAFGC